MTMIAKLSGFLWGGPLLAAFLLVGVYYSVRTGFFQIFRFPLWWRTTVGSLVRKRERTGEGITQLQALSTALAGIIGTGSVAGVAAAIFYGGPGAVFWMWMSALLGAMTGFAEKTLAVRHREKGPDGQWRGGPMQYIKKGLNLPGLAGFVAVLGVAETLLGSNLAQSNSIATALAGTVGADRRMAGIVMAALVSVILVGGIRRISRITELLVPLMAVLYIGGGLAVILVNYRRIPLAAEQIIRYAFSPKAVVGGYSMGAALRYGVARGVFTNEAGLGMASMAHACAEVKEPGEQGMWGIFEVFFATVVICSVTSFVILTSGLYVPEEALEMIRSGTVPPSMLGAPLVAGCFARVMGRAGEWLVTVSLILFAFTSLIGAGYCGKRCVEELCASRWLMALYHLVLPACIIMGAVADLTTVWELVDLLSAMLAIPNLAVLLLLSPEALWCLRRFLAVQRKYDRERSG